MMPKEDIFMVVGVRQDGDDKIGSVMFVRQGDQADLITALSSALMAIAEEMGMEMVDVLDSFRREEALTTLERIKKRGGGKV